MLTPVADRQAALAARFPQWQPRTLDAMLDAAAAEFPDRAYVITDERSYTYRETQAWSVRIARGLSATGVEPGDHVAVVLANYPEFVAVKYAIARAGAVCVPVNFLNRRDELGYVLAQSDAVALITMDRFRGLDYLGMLDELAPGWEQAGGGQALPSLQRVFVFATSADGGREGASTLDELEHTPDVAELPIGEAHPSSAADVLYTSGTTGRPKGVLLTHDMLLRFGYGSAYGRAFGDGRRVLFSLPMYHVFGYVEGMLSVPFVGGAIIPQLAFDPVATLHGIEQHRADDLLLVPTMTMAVLDAARDGDHDLSSLTAVISSGGFSPQWIWEPIFELLGPEEVTTGYGMSETTASTTVTRPDDPVDRLRGSNGRLRDAGVAGDPELGGGRLVDYRVVDPQTGRELPRGEVGEFRARGIGVTAGYYNKPEETAAAFDEQGWLRTGDLGRIDSDDYLTLVGRVKECYRCGGEQVVPKEIEDVLTGHPAVAQAHVVPLPDERMGEVGVAWIVYSGEAAESQELIDYCAQRLARFKVPRHVLPISTEELPTTPSGRPRKFLLERRAAQELL